MGLAIILIPGGFEVEARDLVVDFGGSGLYVVAQAEVEREVRRGFEVVLDETGGVVVVNGRRRDGFA